MTEPRGSGPDPIGDFQRWLLRSGARSMTRELGGHIAGAFGLGGKSGDVWETATAPPPAEAPECAWCPVCRAARLLRESGPGLASHVATASDTLAGLVQDAASVVESALAAAGRRPGPGGEEDQPGGAWSSGTLADLGDVIRRGAGTATEAGREADAPAGPEAEVAAAVWAEATGNGAGPGGHAPRGNGAAGSGAEGSGAEGSGAEGSGAEGNGAEGNGAGSPGSPASPDT